MHAGYTFWESRENIDRVERPALCPATSVPEFPFWAANWHGSDFGPILVLWVYPTVEAREAEWLVTPDHAVESQLGCELPTEYAWVNENAVLVFRTWVTAGEEYLDHVDPPTVFPPVEAFRAMAP